MHLLTHVAVMIIMNRANCSQVLIHWIIFLVITMYSIYKYKFVSLIILISPIFKY